MQIKGSSWRIFPKKCKNSVLCCPHRHNELWNYTPHPKFEIKTFSRWLDTLAFAKTVTKSYMSVKYWDYINHISAMYVPNVAYISRISHPYDIKIRAIFQSFEFGKNLKIWSCLFDFQEHIEQSSAIFQPLLLYFWCPSLHPSPINFDIQYPHTFLWHGIVGVCPEYLQYSVFSDKCYIFIITQWSR